jgi:hypothetical protein
MSAAPAAAMSAALTEESNASFRSAFFMICFPWFIALV